MLRALGRNGGVIMINYFDPLVNRGITNDMMAEVYRRMGGRNVSLNQIWDPIYDVKRAHGVAGASLEDVIAHIDHAVKVAGIDHVGLGSDFDGVWDLPAGLQDVTRLPWITYELMKRGYSEDDMYKLLGGNVLRVMEDVERAASNKG
jgi:membrane dipeptidase